MPCTTCLHLAGTFLGRVNWDTERSGFVSATGPSFTSTMAGGVEFFGRAAYRPGQLWTGESQMKEFLLQHGLLLGASDWPFGLLVALPAVLTTLWLSCRFGVTPVARMLNYCGGLCGVLVVGALWTRIMPRGVSDAFRTTPYSPFLVSALAAFSAAFGVMGVALARKLWMHAWRVVWARWRDRCRT